MTEFTGWIASVGKYMGFRIDKKVVIVGEFLEMDRMMRDEITRSVKKRHS